MRSTTRNLLLGGTATALIVTAMTTFGSDWRPFTDGVENTAASFVDGIGDKLEDGFYWMVNTEVNPATILIGFVAWLTLATIARRANRAWDLTGHTARALKSNTSKGISMWTGIVTLALIVLGGLGIGGAYAGVALGDNLRPQAIAAYDTSERWVGDRIDGLTGKNEPKATPADPAAQSGNTRTEAPVEPAAPVSEEPQAPVNEEPQAPANNGNTSTGDTRTEAPANDKPVTDALNGALTDADRIVTDPVKFADQEPLRAALWALAILMLLLWRVIVWRRNVLIRRELRTLHSYATEDSKLIDTLTKRVTKLEPKGGNRGDTQLIPKV